jgi:hypothetical protein
VRVGQQGAGGWEGHARSVCPAAGAGGQGPAGRGLRPWTLSAPIESLWATASMLLRSMLSPRKESGTLAMALSVTQARV